MNRYYDGQEFTESIDAAEQTLTKLSRSDRLEKPSAESLAQSSRLILGSVIRNSVFPKARSQIASKGMIQLEEPEFPEVLVRQFLELLLKGAGDSTRELASVYLHKSGPTLLPKPLFLEAAARSLGRQWTEDACDFVDTTIATARLQHLVQQLGNSVPHIPESANAPKVLVVCLKNEQHTLMSVILNLLFRSIGWRTGLVFDGEGPSGQGFDVEDDNDILCFSWSNERCMDSVVQVTSRVSRLPSDKRPVVIAGGPAAEPRVTTLRSMGVDCICDTIYAAVNVSERYISLRSSKYRFEEARRLLSHSLHMDSPLY